MNITSLQSEVRKVVQMLVQSDFVGLERLTNGQRLPASEIKSSVEAYRGTLVMPPDSAFNDLLDVVKVEGVTPAAWNVRMPLWTDEEGRSDLTVELLISAKPNDEGYSIRLDGIHVL